jgi:hypothetical protein
LAVWGFPFLLLGFPHPINMGFSFARNSALPPKILHRYSIVTPSFRWSSDGELMDKRWRNHEGKCLHQPSFFAGQIELLSSNKQDRKSVIS